MNAIFELLRRLRKADSFSPEAFVVRAAIISVLYAASRLLDLQEYTAFLSGTSANLNVSWQTASILGLIHLLLHVAFILLVPISLITAGLLAAWNRWKPKRAFPLQEMAAPVEHQLNKAKHAPSSFKTIPRIRSSCMGCLDFRGVSQLVSRH